MLGETTKDHNKPTIPGHSTDNSLIGYEVVQKTPAFRLWSQNAGERKYFHPNFLYIYKIEQVNRQTYFLKVEGTGIEGLADQDDVILVSDMVSFFLLV